MQNINTSKQLKAAILLLEAEQIEKGVMLKAEAIKSLEQYNPANLITYIMEDSKTSPLIIDKILKTGIKIISGLITKKVSGGDSKSIFRKIIGSLVDTGMKHIVSSNSENIKSLSNYLFVNIFKKSE